MPLNFAEMAAEGRSSPKLRRISRLKAILKLLSLQKTSYIHDCLGNILSNIRTKLKIELTIRNQEGFTQEFCRNTETSVSEVGDNFRQGKSTVA